MYQTYAAWAETCPATGAASARLEPARTMRPAESFFGLLKRERVNRRQYRTLAEARSDVFDYIERFHNPRRARKIEKLRQEEVNLTQPSVKTE